MSGPARTGSPRACIVKAAWVQPDWRRPSERAEALAISGGRVLAVGSLADAQAAIGSDAPTLDLGAVCLAPSFHDAHLHLAKVALQARILDIDPAWGLADVLKAVAAAAAASDAPWLVGRGWDHTSWGAWPDAALLDAAAPGRAVCLTRKDGHAVWLSSQALQRAGIDGLPSDPPGGRILRRPDGSPSGILLEQATELAYAVLPPESAAERRGALRAVWPRFWAQGITAVTDMGFRGLDLWQDLCALRASGDLGLRCTLYVMNDGLEDALAADLPGRAPDPWLRAAGLKLFLDGTLGSRTAWMLEPYADHPGRGLATMDPAEASAAVAVAAAHGWPTAAHAIGDAAVRWALDLFETHARDPDGRPLCHRVEHLQRVAPEDLPRFARPGIWASVQPIHLAADWPQADAAWGEDRCAAGAYPWRSVLAAGGRLALGSDAPIEAPDILPGLRLATTRRDLAGRPPGGWQADEALALNAALAAYTWGAAAAAGWDAWLGRLAVGQAADFVVLGGVARDPSGLPMVDGLGDWRILATWLAGQPVWAADDRAAVGGPAALRAGGRHG